MPNDREPIISVNGTLLTDAQAMTVRVAIENFASDLLGGSLGDDEHGVKMTQGYMARIREIREAIFR